MRYFLIFLILMSLFSCSKNSVKKNEKKDIKKAQKVLKTEFKQNLPLLSLPQNTQFLINFKSLKSLFDNFLIKNNTVFGVKIEDGLIDDFKNVFSVDPLSLTDWEKIGFDTQKEFGVGFSDVVIGNNDIESFSIIVYVPVKDKDKVLKFIEDKFENGKLKKSPEENVNFKKENGYLKIYGKRADEVIYMVLKKDLLLIVVNPFNPQNSLNLTTSLVKGESSLKNSAEFKKMYSMLKSDIGIYVYANVQNFIDSNLEKLEKELKRQDEFGALALDFLKDYKSTVFGVYLDNKDFILKMYSSVVENSKTLDLLKGASYNRVNLLGVDKPALMLVTFNLNIKKYLEFLKLKMTESDKKDYERFLKEIKDNYGFDFEKDLLDNLSGGFGFGNYDGISISTTNYNVLLNIGLKDTKKMETVIDKILKSDDFKNEAKYVNKTKLNNETVYIVNAMVTQVYIGFKNNNLIIASSKDMYESALKAQKGHGFYKYAQSEEYLKEIDKKDSFWYLSFLEATKALNNFKAMLPQEVFSVTTDVFEFFKYNYADKEYNNGIFQGSYTIKTSSQKPFFNLISDFVKKYNK